MKNTRKLGYLTLIAAYLAQGIIFFASLTVLPVFFQVYPDIYSVETQSIFITFAKSSAYFKITIGILLELMNKKKIKHAAGWIMTIAWVCLALFSILLAGVRELLTLFLFLFAGLFFLMAAIDTAIDSIAAKFSIMDNRLSISAVMNIAYSLGFVVSSGVYLGITKTTPQDWITYLITAGVLIAVLLLFLPFIRTRMEFPIIELPKDYPVQPNSIRLVGGVVDKSFYLKRILPLSMLLIFIGNVDTLAEITFEKWLVAKFGLQAFDTMVMFSMSIAIPVKILTLILIVVFRNKLKNKEYTMIFIAAVMTLSNWVLFPFVSFNVFLGLMLLMHIAGPLLLVGMTGIIMKILPKDRTAFGYQALALFYSLPIMLLPGIGNQLAEVIGFEAIFFIIAAVIIFVAFPLLVVMRRWDSKIDIPPLNK